MWNTQQTRKKNVISGKKTLMATLAVVALLLSAGGPPQAGAQVEEAEAVICEAAISPALGTECATPVRTAWESVVNGPANSNDDFRDMTVSADGSVAYVVGHMDAVDDDGGFRTLTVTAFDTATGDVVWQYEQDRPGPDDYGNWGFAIALSPDETQLVAAGKPNSPYPPPPTPNIGWDFVSLDAATGSEQWTVREFVDVRVTQPNAVHFVSDTEFIVTGSEQPHWPDGYRLWVSARSAASGDELWQDVHAYSENSERNLYDRGSAVSSDGSTVVVNGYATICCSPPVSNWVAVAWDVDSGTKSWVNEDVSGVAALPGPVVLGDDKAFMSGNVFDYDTGSVPVVMAMDLASGATEWIFEEATFQGNARDNALSSDGSTLFVAGDTSGGPSDYGYFMKALDPETGAEQWTTQTKASPYREQGGFPTIALNEAMEQVSYTGMSPSQSDQYYAHYDFATLAWDTTTGDHLWTARYNGAEDDRDYAKRVAVSPDGSRLIVGGQTVGESGTQDIALVAYDIDVHWTATDLLP